ncbi:MAG: response regulator transcription factor [Bacteroidota bacterium]|nr:response regulator transcription factor [Bacteroidota bacterium]
MQKIALVDDHVLLRNGLANLIESFGDYKVLFQADNGEEFISKFEHHDLPDIVLMDINMPIKDGYFTSLWLKDHHPEIKILALSMYDNEYAIIKMFKAGARGYILKDCDPSELRAALLSLVLQGYYYSEKITGKLVKSINEMDEKGRFSEPEAILNDRETTFLKLACSELTYKEIADQMLVSPRTIDGYRDSLFDKLQVKTRVGLVMYAIRNHIISI